MTQHYFGYQQVDKEEKVRKVDSVFSSVAGRYDLMNDLMSGGMHRLWKQRALKLASIRPGEQVLDLATGSGDLAVKIAERLNGQGRLTAVDINQEMLRQAQARFFNRGHAEITCLQADAEALPFPANHFNCITMGFGLRNVADQKQALKEMQRVLKPGGRVIILEFSRMRSQPLQMLYDAYSFNILPKLGQAVASDAASYQYLAESIRMHPDQETLLNMMKSVDLARCHYLNLSAGIVAIHRGYKP